MLLAILVHFAGPSPAAAQPDAGTPDSLTLLDAVRAALAERPALGRRRRHPAPRRER